MNNLEGPPLLKFEGVTFSYSSKGAPAVAECTFCVKEGEFLSLIGHNSSGKSTIAKMSNGLLKPTKGHVLISGFTTAQDINLLDIRKTVGLVFQNPDNQTVASQVEDDVAFGPENMNLPQPEIRRRVDQALSTVGMLEYAKHPVHHLSGGQKQLVAIAGILAIEPKLLILDEATSLLDPKGRKSVLKKIIQLNESGFAIIMITHRMEEVLLTKRSIALEKGQIIYDGSPQGLFKDNELLKRAGLQRPPLVELAECLIENGISISFPNNSDELVEALCLLK